MNTEDDDAIIFQDSDGHIGIPESTSVTIDTIFQCKTYIIEALLEIIADGLSIKEHQRHLFIQNVNVLFNSLYIQPGGTETEVTKQVIAQVRNAIEEYMALTIKNIAQLYKMPQNNELSIIPSSENLSHVPLEIILKNLKSRFEHDFDVLKQIGRGAYGSVFKVKKKTNKKEYAIKVITLRNSQSDGMYSNREIERLMRFEHPNIVRFYDYWAEFSIEEPDTKTHDQFDTDSMSSEVVVDGTMEVTRSVNSLYKNVKVFIQMELCQKTLTWYLDQRVALHSGRNWRMVRQLLQAVGYLHDCHVVHRDLKPDNVLVNIDNTDTPTLKLTDFGLSRELPSKFPFNGSSVDEKDSQTTCSSEEEDDDEDDEDVDEDDGCLYSSDVNSGGPDNDCPHNDVSISVELQGLTTEEGRVPLRLSDYGFPKELSKDLRHPLNKNTKQHHTHHHHPRPPNASSTHEAHQDTLTHNIGTRPFIAPEVLHEGQDYGSKVDVYAAGMIAFKVFWLIRTEAEMAAMLRSLREGAFEGDEHSINEVHLVRWLTEHLPSERPTAQQALLSEPFQNTELLELSAATKPRSALKCPRCSYVFT